jgi:hypothetical protein
VAAECDINTCGVVAVGRCDLCRNAFCLAHMSNSYRNHCVIHDWERDRQTSARNDALVEDLRRESAAKQDRLTALTETCPTGRDVAAHLASDARAIFASSPNSNVYRLQGLRRLPRAFNRDTNTVVLRRTEDTYGSDRDRSRDVEVLLITRHGEVAHIEEIAWAKWQLVGRWGPDETLPESVRQALLTPR